MNKITNLIMQILSYAPYTLLYSYDKLSYHTGNCLLNKQSLRINMFSKQNRKIFISKKNQTKTLFKRYIENIPESGSLLKKILTTRYTNLMDENVINYSKCTSTRSYHGKLPLTEEMTAIISRENLRHEIHNLKFLIF